MVDGFIKKFSISKLSNVNSEPFFSYMWSLRGLLAVFFPGFFYVKFSYFSIERLKRSVLYKSMVLASIKQEKFVV